MAAGEGAGAAAQVDEGEQEQEQRQRRTATELLRLFRRRQKTSPRLYRRGALPRPGHRPLRGPVDLDLGLPAERGLRAGEDHGGVGGGVGDQLI